MVMFAKGDHVLLANITAFLFASCVSLIFFSSDFVSKPFSVNKLYDVNKSIKAISSLHAVLSFKWNKSIN
jgi:hypothetical protein